ncbi:hypothetical protein BCR44DRAFT_1398723 [Catenaria anguillulae PL171]|uniref:Uncharacterized protein n=1 Tax=Catenaria anguillulae PL171 TaxID=765915 RepID=A0A1Y2I3P0_9FUNG|nr:hypothetical protein BCR44DRAFT_1398723 [Catenaria anguillulae PL171]
MLVISTMANTLRFLLILVLVFAATFCCLDLILARRANARSPANHRRGNASSSKAPQASHVKRSYDFPDPLDAYTHSKWDPFTKSTIVGLNETIFRTRGGHGPVNTTLAK